MSRYLSWVVGVFVISGNGCFRKAKVWRMQHGDQTGESMGRVSVKSVTSKIPDNASHIEFINICVAVVLSV